MIRSFLEWLLVLALLGPAVALALPSDREQPIFIEADRVQIDEPRGVSVYEGNVILTQGTMRITADHVTVHNVGNEVQSIVGLGDPATYRQRPEGQAQDIEGEARRVDYTAHDDTVILQERARLWQGPNEFRSERIVYNLATSVVNAGDAASPAKRVQITIHPQRAEPPPEPAQPGEATQ
jgi:lipopolysaccharide export system protein LptA